VRTGELTTKLQHIPGWATSGSTRQSRCWPALPWPARFAVRIGRHHRFDSRACFDVVFANASCSGCPITRDCCATGGRLRPEANWPFRSRNADTLPTRLHSSWHSKLRSSSTWRRSGRWRARRVRAPAVCRASDGMDSRISSSACRCTAPLARARQSSSDEGTTLLRAKNLLPPDCSTCSWTAMRDASARSSRASPYFYTLSASSSGTDPGSLSSAQ